MSVLMIDVGGTNAKAMIEPEGEVRKVRSGPEFTPKELVRSILEKTADWTFDRISIGYPGMVRQGRPVDDPPNLGQGWVDFDYAAAFEKPVRFINDAAMQALGNYRGGRMLFFGLGTGTGSCAIVDEALIPFQIGFILMDAGKDFDRLSKEALKRDGEERWLEAVHETIRLVEQVFYPDEIVFGGGNSKLLKDLPPNCRRVKNKSAYVGALRLWEDADMFASPCATTWHIHRPGAGARQGSPAPMSF